MFNINISLTGLELTKQKLLALHAQLDKETCHTALAVHDATKDVQKEWVNTAMQAFKHPSGAYTGAIEEGITYPYGSHLAGKVENRAPHAAAIEEGVKDFDQHKALQTSHQVRISKKGKKYLIIPFRHGTPGTRQSPPMPQSVYNMAQNLVASQQKRGPYVPSMNIQSRTSPRAFVAGPGSSVAAPAAQRFQYQWGGRVEESDVGDLDKRDDWTTSPYTRMYKFQAPTGTGTAYLTFRTMSEGSKGWYNQGFAGMHLARNTADKLRGPILFKVLVGFYKDVAEIERIASTAGV